MASIIAYLCSLAAVTVAANPLQSRQTTTAVVNFGNNTGAPQHLASGTLYGLPDATTQIPSSFFKNIGWNYERAGGAQDPGNTGWIGGLASYQYVEVPFRFMRASFESLTLPGHASQLCETTMSQPELTAAHSSC